VHQQVRIPADRAGEVRVGRIRQAEVADVVRAIHRLLHRAQQHGLQHLRDAVELLERKASPDEVDGYRRFILTLADKVANAHREGDTDVSEAEHAAIDEISASLGSSGG